MTQEVYLVDVFTNGGKGGNTAPIVPAAIGWAEARMKRLASHHSRESGFVFPVDERSEADFALRFFVPEHEMEMCGHATVGIAYLMHELGIWTKGDEIKFMTLSGRVDTRKTIDATGCTLVHVSQPNGTIATVSDPGLVKGILDVLGITASELASDIEVQNACTSRIKTTIPLKSVEVLNNLKPDFSKVQELCDGLGSTGLYPYAVVSTLDDKAKTLTVEARQFPRSSGYPEDAATGIAAAALSYSLLANGLVSVGQDVNVHQGRTMGFHSEINVHLEGRGCWIGGHCAVRS